MDQRRVVLDPVAAVEIGGLIASVSGLGAQYISHRLQLERERMAHDRAARDAEHERLRKAYHRMLNAVETYRAVVDDIAADMDYSYSEMGRWKLSNEHQKRLQQALRDAERETGPARIALILEDVGSASEKRFREVTNAFYACRRAASQIGLPPVDPNEFPHWAFARLPDESIDSPSNPEAGFERGKDKLTRRSKLSKSS
jgi:hypothetical protein